MKKNIVILLILVIGLVGSYAAQGFTKSGNSDKKTVRIGYFPNVTHAPALIAKNQKLFEKSLGDAVKVEWKEFNAGPAAVEAIFAGEIDLSYIGPGPAITSYTQSNGDVQVLSGVTDGGAILVTAKDSGINSAEDLSGKTISIPQTANTQDITLRGFLKEKNIENVNVVQGKNADVRGLLERGEIDGAFVPEPWGSILVEELDAKIILDNDQAYKNGDYPTTVIIGRKEYLESNKDVIGKILYEEEKIAAHINEDRGWAKAIVADELTKLTGKSYSDFVLDESFERMEFTSEIRIQDLKDIFDIFLDNGFVKEDNELKNIVWSGEK